MSFNLYRAHLHEKGLFTFGDYVRVAGPFPALGRVTQVRRKGLRPEERPWFEMQQRPYDDADFGGPWVTVLLTQNGGVGMFAARFVEQIDPFNFTNDDAGKYWPGEYPTTTPGAST